MDARRLVLFAAVLEHGSFTRAAGALHLSQPSLSRQVGALEREAGIRLLNRLPAGVTATAAGERIGRRARAVRAQLEAAERELQELRGLREGQLRLAAFPTAAATLALDALVSVRAAHPGLAISVEECDPGAAIDAVLTGRVDIAVTFGDAATTPADDVLETTVLLEEAMLVALPVHHALAGAGPVLLSALRDAPWIAGTDRGTPGLIRRACLAAGFEPRIVARLDNQPAIQAAVAADVGVTLIPALATRRADPGIAFERVRAPAPSRRVLVHALGGPRQPATDAGLAALHAAAAHRDIGAGVSAR